MSLKEQLNQAIRRNGFEHFNWTSLQKPLSMDFYSRWLEQGFHGEMSYLERHAPLKQEPQKLFNQARSFLVLLVPYLPFPEEHQRRPLKSLKIARYAQGRDYHDWIGERLEQLIREFKEIHPQAEFLAATDSKPVLERDLAYRAGLGWIGKNTCLLNTQQGSLFFIAEILSSFEFHEAPPVATDHCGKCTRCMDACPTQAFTESRSLDARKCISYWTIEAKSNPPAELRSKMGTWFFGCDICQSVCPWNEKVLGTELKRSETLDSKPDMIKDLRGILKASRQELEKLLCDTPLLRSGFKGLKRNALLVAANARLKELVPEIEALQTEDAQLLEMKSWALSQLAE